MDPFSLSIFTKHRKNQRVKAVDNALVEDHKDYKYFQNSALRYQLWPSFSKLIFNENASFLEFEFRLRVHFK